MADVRAQKRIEELEDEIRRGGTGAANSVGPLVNLVGLAKAPAAWVLEQVEAAARKYKPKGLEGMLEGAVPRRKKLERAIIAAQNPEKQIRAKTPELAVRRFQRESPEDFKSIRGGVYTTLGDDETAAKTSRWYRQLSHDEREVPYGGKNQVEGKVNPGYTIGVDRRDASGRELIYKLLGEKWDKFAQEALDYRKKTSYEDNELRRLLRREEIRKLKSQPAVAKENLPDHLIDDFVNLAKNNRFLGVNRTDLRKIAPGLGSHLPSVPRETLAFLAAQKAGIGSVDSLFSRRARVREKADPAKNAPGEEIILLPNFRNEPPGRVINLDSVLDSLKLPRLRKVEEK